MMLGSLESVVSQAVEPLSEPEHLDRCVGIHRGKPHVARAAGRVGPFQRNRFHTGMCANLLEAALQPTACSGQQADATRASAVIQNSMLRFAGRRVPS